MTGGTSRGRPAAGTSLGPVSLLGIGYGDQDAGGFFRP
jgi:hypothetical protein